MTDILGDLELKYRQFLDKNGKDPDYLLIGDVDYEKANNQHYDLFDKNREHNSILTYRGIEICITTTIFPGDYCFVTKGE